MRNHIQRGVSVIAMLAVAPAMAQTAGPDSRPVEQAAAAPGVPQTTGPETRPVDPTAAPEAASGDIIVTATRRETTLQKTPIAVSVFSQAQLDRQLIVNPADLQRFVPSLQFNQQADNNAILITLRGIGNDKCFHR